MKHCLLFFILSKYPLMAHFLNYISGLLFYINRLKYFSLFLKNFQRGIFSFLSIIPLKNTEKFLTIAQIQVKQR